MVAIPTAVKRLHRRRVLRGMVGGAAVSVGLPLLNCFLNGNGAALAAGGPLPTCFGTFFFGLGFNPGRWEPEAIGANYTMAPELSALAPFRDKINIYTGMQAFLDGRPNRVHDTGVQVCMHGEIARSREATPPSIDSLIGDVIGTRTRFRSIEVSSIGSSRGYSSRGRGEVNPSEVSPAALYARIFGPEFQDPNAATFTPDPLMLARKSVLSGMSEQRAALVRDLGAEDRARLDGYFTSLRELENQVSLSLQKPEPLQACTTPQTEKDPTTGTVVENVLATNKLFSGLLAHTLACGQTRVFNSIYTSALSTIRRAGSADTHHVLTHEEKADEKTGYQPETTWFNERSVEALVDLITALSNLHEGPGTLLDRTVIYVSTDTGRAAVHSLINMPLITVGSAGGRMKTGIHYHGNSDPVTRVGLTIQRALGVPTSSWGNDSNTTSAHINDVLA